MTLRLLQHRSDSGERAVIAAQGDAAHFVPGFASIRALALHAIAQGISLAQAVDTAGKDGKKPPPRPERPPSDAKKPPPPFLDKDGKPMPRPPFLDENGKPNKKKGKRPPPPMRAEDRKAGKEEARPRAEVACATRELTRGFPARRWTNTWPRCTIGGARRTWIA